jgi:hypothetical protein
MVELGLVVSSSGGHPAHILIYELCGSTIYEFYEISTLFSLFLTAFLYK